MTTSERTRAEIRRPAQKRSRARFEAILDGAERLLDTLPPSAISIHAIAAEVGISPPSIYHFFPEPHLVFSALAERYLKRFEEGVLTEVPDDIESWQELQTLAISRRPGPGSTRTPRRAGAARRPGMVVGHPRTGSRQQFRDGGPQYRSDDPEVHHARDPRPPRPACRGDRDQRRDMVAVDPPGTA